MDREQYNSEFVNAAAEGNASLVAHYLRAVDQSSVDNALIQAAEKGHVDCVQKLIRLTTNAAQWLALQKAIVTNEHECVKELIPFCPPSGPEWRPLNLAAAAGSVECLTLLIEAQPMSNMQIPLRAAAVLGHAKCVKLLLSYALPLADGAKLFVDTLLENKIECLNLLIPHCDLQECHAYLLQNHPGTENEQHLQSVIAQWQRDTLTTALTDYTPSSFLPPRKI